MIGRNGKQRFGKARWLAETVKSVSMNVRISSVHMQIKRLRETLCSVIWLAETIWNARNVVETQTLCKDFKTHPKRINGQYIYIYIYVCVCVCVYVCVCVTQKKKKQKKKKTNKKTYVRRLCYCPCFFRLMVVVNGNIVDNHAYYFILCGLCFQRQLFNISPHFIIVQIIIV